MQCSDVWKLCSHLLPCAMLPKQDRECTKETVYKTYCTVHFGSPNVLHNHDPPLSPSFVVFALHLILLRAVKVVGKLEDFN